MNRREIDGSAIGELAINGQEINRPVINGSAIDELAINELAIDGQEIYRPAINRSTINGSVIEPGVNMSSKWCKGV